MGIPFIIRARPLQSRLNGGKCFSTVLEMRGLYGDALAKATEYLKMRYEASVCHGIPKMIEQANIEKKLPD